MPKTLSTAELKELALKTANKYHLNSSQFLGTIQCESQWNTKAVGDNGTSFGLAQLHYPERDWGLTVEQAETPQIALETMAIAWTKGLQLKWSCYRILFSK